MEFPEEWLGGMESEAKAGSELREGLPDGTGCGNRMRALFWARKTASARLSWPYDAAFPVRAHLCGAAGELFRPCRADPCDGPAADQAEPGACHRSRARSRAARD